MLSTRLLNDPTEFSLLFFSGGGGGGAGRIIQAPEWHLGACSSSWGGLLLGKMGDSACISGGMRVGNAGFWAVWGRGSPPAIPTWKLLGPGSQFYSICVSQTHGGRRESCLRPPPRSPRSPRGEEELGEVGEAGLCPWQLRLAV